jgi:DNA gyrase subunit A
MYSTGKGSITVRAKSHIETVAGQQKQAKSCIVVDELPYMVVKSGYSNMYRVLSSIIMLCNLFTYLNIDLIANIAQLVNSKQLEGISDIRDESDRSGMRVVIELKRDANVNVVLNNLYKKTKLQNIFSGNMIALVENGKQPKLLTLRDMIDEFLSFRHVLCFCSILLCIDHYVSML